MLSPADPSIYPDVVSLTVSFGTTLNVSSNISHICPLDLYFSDTLFVIVYSSVVVVGIPANLAALYSICHLIKSKPTQLIFLLNLTLADLLYLLFLPLWIIYFRHNHTWTLGSTACKAVGAMFFINMYTSIYFLCCIAIDRFLAVIFPFRFRRLQSLKCYIGVALTGWLLATLSHLPVVLCLNLQYSDFCYQGYVQSQFHAAINIFASVFGFLCPFCILLFTHQATIRRIGKATLRPGSATLIKWLLLACFLTFVLCFGPYHCLALAQAGHYLEYGPDCEFLQSIHSYYRISIAVTSLATLLDPVLYIFISEDVRNQMNRLRFPAGCKFTTT
ncbi:ovarian cancer G-protein coupled receptor 1-like [Hyperolius riggenbachi]|uniref:ovarian cancer G-protein coupled receptor 1-like n=1 Tax=Hyperolius riggenbachi TaxID=752182 RepID=UPI0035A352B7